MEQLGIRIALKCSEEDATIILGQAKDSIRQIATKDPGSAIMIPNYTNSSEYHQIRIAFLKSEDQRKYLKVIETHYKKHRIANAGVRKQTKVLVARIEDSKNNPFQAFVGEGRMESNPFFLHLGEAMDMRPSYRIEIKKRTPRENLLIAGENYDKADSVLYYILLDLAIAKLRAIKSGAKDGLNIIYFDIDNPTPNSPINILLKSVGACVLRVNTSEALKGLEKIYNVIKSGKFQNSITWLAFANLNYMDMLSAGAYSSNANGFVMLEELARTDANGEVHLVAYVDNLSVFENLYPGLITHFGKHVAFNLPDVEAKQFVRTDEASIRGDAAAFFVSGRKTEIFRPYLLPETDWQKRLFQRIQNSK
jgi:hypothetical protein